MEQTFMKGNVVVPHWNGQRQMSEMSQGVLSTLRASNHNLVPSVLYKTNSIH